MGLGADAVNGSAGSLLAVDQVDQPIQLAVD